MIRPNVVQLRQFYSSPLGRLVRVQLADAVQAHWPELSRDLMVGLGYANPVLRPYLQHEAAEQCLLVPLMPAQQGAIYWPSHRENRTLLVEDDQLPFRDNVINRAVLLHALEYAESPHRMLAELWRVLAPGGRMLVLVPNRRSAWASLSNTPFSSGVPYSVSQLREMLCEDGFTYVDSRMCVHVWPSKRRWVQRISGFVGRWLRWVFPVLGGVIVIEVEKQIYASVKEPVRAFRARAVYAPVGRKPAMTREPS